jgi:threonine aldolase
MFASDNASGVHPAVFEAMLAANTDHALAYGYDAWTARAEAVFQEQFGADTRVYFALSGTGANVLGLSNLLRSWEAIITSELAHLALDETGGPERWIGCKVLTVPHHDGKVRPADLERHIKHIGFEHSAQPRVVSVSQPTEYGTVYTVPELEAIAAFCRRNRLYFHMDGARIANAAVALGLPFRAFTRDVGVDLLSFGGTKNGLMNAEAMVFLTPGLDTHLRYLRKQSLQLASKMRFIAAQFLAWFDNDLWAANARHANTCARQLADGARQIPGITITRPVETNVVFATIPAMALAPVLQSHYFYIWDEKTLELRWMTSFDTTEADIQAFLAALATHVPAAL